MVLNRNEINISLVGCFSLVLQRFLFLTKGVMNMDHLSCCKKKVSSYRVAQRINFKGVLANILQYKAALVKAF